MKLEDLERLLAAATPGPWESRDDEYGNEYWRVTTVGADPYDYARVAFDDGGAHGEHVRKCTPETRDAIVALMNAAPALLRVAKAAREMVAEGCLDPTFGIDARMIAAVEALEVDDGRRD